MNIPEQEIVNVLRHAPVPKPPVGLKQQLISQMPSLQVQRSGDPNPSREYKGSSSLTRARDGWLKRWWPLLAPSAGCLACAVVLTMQQIEIRDLQATSAALAQKSTQESPSVVPQAGSNDATSSTEAYDQEIARLKQTASQLETELAQLEQMRSQNTKLRTQLATRSVVSMTAEETEAMAKAKERADSIRCVNNLKQFGLAVRVWSLDNRDTFPPNIVCMSNELSTPIILVCPADSGRIVAPDFASFTPANSSYEFLAASASDNEPTRLLSRCPIHGNIGLCDGSVQRGVAKDHPEWLVPRDGKLYFEPPRQLDPAFQKPAASKSGQPNDPPVTNPKP